MNSPKNVGFLLSRVDCNDGIASHCETLMRGLKNLGWKVVLITGKVSFDSSSLKRFESLKELSEEWIVIDDFNRSLPSWATVSQILDAVKRLEIQVFHAHGYSMLFVAAIAKIFTKVRCIATSHLLKSANSDKVADSHPEGQRARFKRAVLKQYLRFFAPHTFIAISSDIEQWLIEDIGIAKSQIKKVFNGINTQYFHVPNAEERRQSREKFNLSEQDFAIALVGRTQWDKGHKLLIDAVNQIVARNPQSNCKCLFAGSGDQREEIEAYALANAQNQQRFLFLGYVTEPRQVYWAADVIVLPSQAEGFPLVIVESMACGVVPIRTPAAGAYDQIEDGVNGFIIPFNDLEMLSSRLLQLSENPDLRSRMVENTLKFTAQKFTLESMTLSTVAAYEEAIK